MNLNPEPIEPVITLRLFEPRGVGLWTGDITNCTGRQLASASASSVWAVWAMLEAIVRREVPGEGEDE